MDLKVLEQIAQVIFDKKGFNILVIDVRGLSSITDFFLIAEGTVDRHTRALSQAVLDRVEALGYQLLRIEGKNTGDWIVLDFGEILVHLFVPEIRQKYQLEQIWKEGSIVDLDIKTTHIKEES